YTPEHTSRILWETSKALRRFCLVSDDSELIRIFPEARARAENGVPLKINLALLSLDGPRSTRAFGLNLLFDEMERFENIELLARAGLGMSDFFRMDPDVDAVAMAIEESKWFENRHDNLFEEYQKLAA